MRNTLLLCVAGAINALVPDGSASQRTKPQKVATLEPPRVAAPPTLKTTLARRPGLAAVEAQLARLTRDPQELLEAVVGLPGPETSYDRDTLVDFWARRPEKVVTGATTHARSTEEPHGPPCSLKDHARHCSKTLTVVPGRCSQLSGLHTHRAANPTQTPTPCSRPRTGPAEGAGKRRV